MLWLQEKAYQIFFCLHIFPVLTLTYGLCFAYRHFCHSEMFIYFSALWYCAVRTEFAMRIVRIHCTSLFWAVVVYFFMCAQSAQLFHYYYRCWCYFHCVIFPGSLEKMHANCIVCIHSHIYEDSIPINSNAQVVNIQCMLRNLSMQLFTS